ncbi:hypothetical protein [uncultured Selenomonas sp.]|uniref:hypothetical protein n=1 Tax=uncultured Selenomonas sp. TaxID=159275 RepID=UPI0028DCBB8D|nr:hypothetical protein [uncultured Selenomonas sp.]
MGILNIAGKVVGAIFSSLWEKAGEANNARMSSGHMSDRELAKAVLDKRNSYPQRVGYRQALEERIEERQSKK